ncbi:MAG TPA: metallophosphoesterase [Acidimicrobiales bacterium]
MDKITRRRFIAGGIGAVGAVAVGGLLVDQAWPLLAREDLIPGKAPEKTLTPNAWEETPDQLTFAAIGDNGSGGRQAMAVAGQMADTYALRPYGLVCLLGDICYYGDIRDRFHDVFEEPMEPLIEAGVRFELSIGNHDGNLDASGSSLEEIEAELALLGTPGRYYTTSHGPVDFFYLDSNEPDLIGQEQLDWFDAALEASDNMWKVVCVHHPPYSSGWYGSTPGEAEKLSPILSKHAVDLVMSGHDHHYERIVPIDGTTYVVSGGGCKTTPVTPSEITAVAESTLEFVHFTVDGDRLTGEAIRPNGSLVDRFELRAREGR